MTGAVLRPVDLGLRRLLPLVTALAAILLDLLPLPSPGPWGLASFLTLGVVYFWSLYRPDLFTYGAAFVVGLLYDAVAGLPLGLSALALLLARHAMVAHQRFFLAKSFAVVWFCFALLALAVEGLRFLVACLWWGRLFSLSPLLFEIGLTVALYPVLSWLLVQVHARIPRVAHEP